MAAKLLVYRNLHKQCWSVKHNGRVIGHRNWIHVTGDLWGSCAGFQVSEFGRQKVIKEGRKNVHAYVFAYPQYIELDEAKVCEWAKTTAFSKLTRVTYNPYENSTFVTAFVDTTVPQYPVGWAETIWLTPGGVFVEKPHSPI